MSNLITGFSTPPAKPLPANIETLRAQARELEGVFALQSELAQSVAQSLLGVLPRDTQAITRRLSPTRSVAAYDAYLHGVQQLEHPGANDGKSAPRAIGFFQEALAADPGFARAQAGICRAGSSFSRSSR